MGKSGGRVLETVQTKAAPPHRMPKPGHTPGSATYQSTGPSGSFMQQSPASPVMTERVEEENGSTTAYLNEKARQDAIEHAKEDREEEMRLRKAYGGLRVAMRLYEGDSIPQGKRLSVCSYCGAENLLPMGARERYCCYFCREPLT